MEWAEIKSMVSFLHEVHKAIRGPDVSVLSDAEAQRIQRQIKRVHGVIHTLQKAMSEVETGKKKDMLSHLLQEAQECRDQLLDQFAGSLGYDWLFADRLQ
ncbi:MAG: hypothetical protein M1376_11780 [Planctomycetes bacterium]|nr:hypothetical protein [Planctomycetota bacterium]